MRRGLALWLASVALVVTAAGGAIAAVGTGHLSHEQSQRDAQATALAAARQIAVDFAAYDYRQIDKDFARVAAESTGNFRQQYLTQSAGVRDLIIQVKAVSTAEVAAAGLVSATGRTAVVIVALNRTVANTKVPKGTTDAFGVQITLNRHGGQWLATDVKPL